MNEARYLVDIKSAVHIRIIFSASKQPERTTEGRKEGRKGGREEGSFLTPADASLKYAFLVARASVILITAIILCEMLSALQPLHLTAGRFPTELLYSSI